MTLGGNGSEEDVLTYTMFPKAATQFFQSRTAGSKEIMRELGEAKADPAPALLRSASSRAKTGTCRSYIIEVSGEEHKVTVTRAP
jgi:methylmalonyl-CoA carboxyltransferase 5S subunit